MGSASGSAQPSRFRPEASLCYSAEQTGSFRFVVNGPNREISMKLSRMILAGAMLAAVPSVTLAQQPLTGTVTTIDRINGTIGVRQAQKDTVGANGGGATEQQFKAAPGLLD